MRKAIILYDLGVDKWMIFTNCNQVIHYVVEGNNLFNQCSECGQGLHTKSQAKACMKQNPSLRSGSELNKYYFSRFERFWRWLVY